MESVPFVLTCSGCPNSQPSLRKYMDRADTMTYPNFRFSSLTDIDMITLGTY
jgi:hypothetical protein